MTTTHADVRAFLLQELQSELVGPRQPDEILTEDPTLRYLTGILYPQNSQVDAEEDRDSNELSEDDEVGDEGVMMSATYNPSALGLTFAVPPGSELSVQVSAAIYVADGKDRDRKWRRQVLDLEPAHIRADAAGTDSQELNPGLQLFVRLRSRGDRLVCTLTLVNKHVERPGERGSALAFFQPEIEVTAAREGESIFLPRSEQVDIQQQSDRLLNDLLYRHAPEYAVGHGCAATWDVMPGEKHAYAIRTRIMPAHELLQFSPDPEIPFEAQKMRFLANADPAELVRELRKLPAGYRTWLESLNSGAVPERLRTAATDNLEQCRLTADRIEAGIDLLESDQQARLAFQMANQAMLLQRGRITWMRTTEDERPPEPVLDDSHQWRPFQLAFILLALPSMVDPENEWRDVVDLLWFPTGGGKTEAYLGLTAFTIFHRRLRLDGSSRASGVTVLMRYTLRLLTIQQFQRAATLILACEHLRRTRKDDVPGEEEISLGLWVGGGATPNNLKQASEKLDALLNEDRVLEGNPYQIHHCPWCGARITPRDYRVEASLHINCPNTECDFAGRLPLYVVDEDVYRWKPTLLIGTVDKFARLPWLGQTSALFGGIQGEHLPPELIIQDELHLISGPLGTLVGLYETAVDILCTKDGAPPKIIASTATIRRAAEQSRGLFNRDFAQFPPPALDARDNYFSHQVPPEERPGRLYVGIHASGRSMKTALTRIYATLLQRIAELNTVKDDLRDPYWTLVAYFNSMRELGGAVRLVESDVPDHIYLLARREGIERRFINDYRELNSRIGSDRIPELLDLMETPLGQDNYPLDVLLATNMISVGIDVDRLGLMVVAGQPKTTSEYIQATSRVGRRYPGLVITLYNWSRPRDRSHYERFHSYHETLYSQVEPTSVTPFSDRARDRGLHGVYITLLRHLDPEMNPAEAAHHYDPDSALARQVMEMILARVAAIDPNEVDDTREMLQNISQRWDRLANQQPLPYGVFNRQPGDTHLMVAAEDEDRGMMFPTLNSLREVEGEAGIFFPRSAMQEKA